MNKETEVDTLWRLLHARDSSIRELRAQMQAQQFAMEEKEGVIHQLKSVCDERERLLQAHQMRVMTRGAQRGLSRTLSLRKRASLDGRQTDRHAMPSSTSAGQMGDASSEPAAALVGQLTLKAAELDAAHQRALALAHEKEQTIGQLRRAVRAYRAAFFFVRPFMPLIRAVANLGRLFVPKIGRLHHHPPIPLAVPRPSVAIPGEDWPSISVVTPSFRQGKFIERTMLSVLDQGYPRLEYFVQDGGSTDETVAVLQQYELRLSGWASVRDAGQSQAINLGFARTSGDVMAWLNSDDLLMPGALARVGAYFAAHPEVDVVYGHRILIDEKDQEIGRWLLPAHSDEVLSWADFVPQETLFWRRSLWEKVGGINDNFRFAMDWDLLLRFREAGARMVRLPYFLGAFRIHEAQKTSAVINDVGQHEMALLRRRVLNRDVEWHEIRRALVPYLIRHLFHDWAFRVRRRLGALQ